MAEEKKVVERQREGQYATRTVTKIWDEEASDHNPYLAKKCRCHGYDLIELIRKRSFVDVFFLMFIGELPGKDQSELLETLMIGLMNPGPRHPATRASMNAGVGKTNAAHILPISLNVLSGDHLGASEVMAAMRFFKSNMKKDPAKCAEELLGKATPPKEGDWHIAPGFGNRFGGIDPVPQQIAEIIVSLPGSKDALKWSDLFAKALKPHGMGWLTTGIAAAVLYDLGFDRLSGPGIFQFISAPGLLAHGLEFADKPITAMQFPDDKHYIIAESAKKRKNMGKKESDV